MSKNLDDNVLADSEISTESALGILRSDVDIVYLILVARRLDKLSALAVELEKEYRVSGEISDHLVMVQMHVTATARLILAGVRALGRSRIIRKKAGR